MSQTQPLSRDSGSFANSAFGIFTCVVVVGMALGIAWLCSGTSVAQGQVVDHLPDGREIRLYRQANGDRVYVVQGSTTITANESSGKSRKTLVTVEQP